MPTTELTAKPRTRVVYVYVGMLQKSPHAHLPAEDRAEVLHLYYEVDTTEPDGWSYVRDAEQVVKQGLYNKEISHGTPGTVCSFESNEEGTSVYPNTRQYMGRWRVEADVAQWQAANDAVRRVIETARAEARGLTERPDLELLEPFRRAYAEASGPARVQIIARIAAYVAGMTESRMRLARKNIDKDVTKTEKQPAKGRKKSA